MTADHDDGIVRTATLTCPHCGHASRETMPDDACTWFHDCADCGALLRPKPGDCCVFCSWGDAPCPPVQRDGACC
ncbi:MAG: GDCCVxC domain-containing (seleno)protein [Halofilum sp. (in: g-proteobacteria)]|nr:GDCCVxC domain-containing (seleno)protein [Halofilum sp. (in: g-proteobacteria)]